MPRLQEQLQTTLSIDEAFAFVADFANASRWDPGVAHAERIGSAGPVGVDTRYRLGIRMGGGVAPMEYRVVSLEPPFRVVLTGEGSGVTARDEIRFAPLGTGTSIDYLAEIRLRGLRSLLTPFARGTFARIARDARDGMQRTLDELARQRADGSAR